MNKSWFDFILFEGSIFIYSTYKIEEQAYQPGGDIKVVLYKRTPFQRFKALIS